MITLFIADQITEQKSLVPNHNSLYFDVFWVHRFQSGWESSIFYILYIYGTILYNLVATLARKRMAGPRFPTHGRTLWLVRSGQIATTPRLGNGSSLLVFSSLDLSNECFYLHNRHNIALHWMRSPLEWMGPFHVIFSHFFHLPGSCNKCKALWPISHELLVLQQPRRSDTAAYDSWTRMEDVSTIRRHV